MYAGRAKMKAMASKYGSVTERLAAPMTRAPALRLKGLAKEVYQPEQYAVGLSFDEATRRIDTRKAEIDQAILFRDGAGLLCLAAERPLDAFAAVADLLDGFLHRRR